MIYVDDLPAAMDFYHRALGLKPRFYDAVAGYAELGPEGHLSLAAQRAGELMMPGAYNQHGRKVSAVEVAFYTHVQSSEGTILGFATPKGGA